VSYIANNEKDIAEMLKEIGIESVEELFSSIPPELKLKKSLNLPSQLSEMDLLEHTNILSKKNLNLNNYISFLGGGIYNHYIPSVVNHLIGRSEFYTSYTPYQPEMSQGTLQVIFEYQTLICMLTGMEVSNASMYDGASATAEAVLMAMRVKGKRKAIVSRALHPEYRKVIKTYLDFGQREMVECPVDERGVTDIDALKSSVDDSVACVVIQFPNFFGILEDLEELERIIHSKGALFICVFTEPLTFGFIKPPGEYNADIVCGEGQSLGIPPGFGGPGLGILTCKKEFIRNMPGRIVGETVDVKGRRAYVLTLSAREQHIRREKSTSNICTNHGLCALAATVYMSYLGKSGLKKLSLINLSLADYVKKELFRVKGVQLKFNMPTFNEFVIQIEKSIQGIIEAMYREMIFPGIPLGRFYPELSNCILVTVTEKNSMVEIEKLCNCIKTLLER